MDEIEKLKAEIKFKDAVIQQLKDLVKDLEKKLGEYKYFVSP